MDYTQGTPSSLSDATPSSLVNYTSKNILIDNTAASLPTTNAHSFFNAGFECPIATRDTNASQAWQDGWIGLNQIIGFLDEFDAGDAVGLINSDDITIDSHGKKVSFIDNSVAPEAALFSADPSLSFGVDLNYRLNSALLVSTSILNFAGIGGSDRAEIVFRVNSIAALALPRQIQKIATLPIPPPPNLNYR